MEEKKNTTSLLFATTASSSNLHAENNMIKSEKKSKSERVSNFVTKFCCVFDKIQSILCLLNLAQMSNFWSNWKYSK